MPDWEAQDDGHRRLNARVKHELRNASFRRVLEDAGQSLMVPYGVGYFLPANVISGLLSSSRWGLSTLAWLYGQIQLGLQAVRVVDDVGQAATGAQNYADGVGFWEAAVRWFVYNVALCYLYPMEPGTDHQPNHRWADTRRQHHSHFPCRTRVLPHAAIQAAQLAHARRDA